MTARPTGPSADRVVTLYTLVEHRARDRAAGRSVVLTNGCFDVLHVGHLHLLESAAAEADILVVALNSDESVRRLKGAGRPVMPFDERAGLIAGLAVVDWVVGFDDDTPAALIERLVPDVLVKGDDWSKDRIVGREVVEGSGGRVVTVPRVPDRSTTRLLRRIGSLS
jgi:rfaE bifunctional protein nucleotidyltransferase chain/domain